MNTATLLHRPSNSAMIPPVGGVSVRLDWINQDYFIETHPGHLKPVLVEALAMLEAMGLEPLDEDEFPAQCWPDGRVRIYFAVL